MRHSGLQLEVLSLYRSLLRASRKKGGGVQTAVKAKFREMSGSISAKDIDKVEHFIRYGKKQKMMLEMPGVNMIRST